MLARCSVFAELCLFNCNNICISYCFYSASVVIIVSAGFMAVSEHHNHLLNALELTPFDESRVSYLRNLRSGLKFDLALRICITTAEVPLLIDDCSAYDPQRVLDSRFNKDTADGSLIYGRSHQSDGLTVYLQVCSGY